MRYLEYNVRYLEYNACYLEYNVRYLEYIVCYLGYIVLLPRVKRVVPEEKWASAVQRPKQIPLRMAEPRAAPRV